MHGWALARAILGTGQAHVLRGKSNNGHLRKHPVGIYVNALPNLGTATPTDRPGTFPDDGLCVETKGMEICRNPHFITLSHGNPRLSKNWEAGGDD